MDLINPIISVVPKILNLSMHKATSGVMDDLRSSLDNHKSILEDLQRINALRVEHDKHIMTGGRYIKLPRVGYKKYDFSWFVNNSDRFEHAAETLELAGIKSSNNLLFEIAYGSHCIFEHGEVPKKFKDGIGPLFKVMKEPLFCSPTNVAPSAIYGVIGSRIKALELMVVFKTLALEEKPLDVYKIDSIQDILAGAFLCADESLRQKIINGYNPTDKPNDSIFMPDGSYNYLTEYETSVYQIHRIIKWVDFWLKEDFDMAVSLSM